MKKLFIIFLSIVLLGCSKNNIKLEKLEGFNEIKYLGKWYEIARIDNSFEKNLTEVTAEYSLSNDGTIRVVNKGYDFINKKFKIIEGRAKIVDNGIFKVYFNPIFGGNYNVLYVDDNYNYALVGGGNKNFLWILNRTEKLDENIYENLKEIARKKGYNTDKLIKN